MIQSPETSAVRIFLFKPEHVDMFHLRLAIRMSSLRGELQVLDQDAHGLRLASILVRVRADPPSLILFQQDRERSASLEMLGQLRESKELGALPLVVIGDGESPDAERLALLHGADAFLALPTRASELANTGRDIERFWREHGGRRPARSPRSSLLSPDPERVS